jgi:hypothetical protein
MTELASVVGYSSPRRRLPPSRDNSVDDFCGNSWHVTEQHHDGVALAGGIQTCQQRRRTSLSVAIVVYRLGALEGEGILSLLATASEYQVNAC